LFRRSWGLLERIFGQCSTGKGRFGCQRSMTVASRSQLGFPA
jgi:hypothetical protein